MTRLLPAVLLAVLLPACATAPQTSRSTASEATLESASDPRQPLPPTRVIAVGDTMLGSDFPSNRLPPNDGRDLLAPVVDILRGGDISFVNVEGVLMDGGEAAKTCSNPSLCYLFRSPASYADTLAWAGFNVASLANNHARDFGEDGRSASMAALSASGIAHTGREGDIASMTVNGVRIAVVGFAPNIGSWSIHDIDAAAYLVEGLSIGHDLVLVSFHGGAEGSDAIHVTPGVETYYGENRGDLIAFSHAVIDAGADLVIGHGPHVPRALELYKDRLIAYSLGNFATHWGISVSGRKGYAPILDVTLSGQGEFIAGQLHSAIQQRPNGVFPDPDQRALELVRELTNHDFNGGGLFFTPEGRLYPASTNQSAASPDRPPLPSGSR
ncbi:MAG: CapA family protein [Gammaproteobacteria bacterium]|nr:CapA family protein [Gammaproteobacteria bacterium]